MSTPSLLALLSTPAGPSASGSHSNSSLSTPAGPSASGGRSTTSSLNSVIVSAPPSPAVSAALPLVLSVPASGSAASLVSTVSATGSGVSSAVSSQGVVCTSSFSGSTQRSGVPGSNALSCIGGAMKRVGLIDNAMVVTV